MKPDDDAAPNPTPAAQETSSASTPAPDYSEILIRPIQPSDAAELNDAFEHWSEESRYRRFHTGIRHLTKGLLDYLTHVDGIDHVALVAQLAHEPMTGVGVGRFVRLPHAADRADLALAVTDDAQGHGVARRLLIELAHAAHARGIATFCMDVLGSNDHVRELLASVGARCVRAEEGVLSYELALTTLREQERQMPQL